MDTGDWRSMTAWELAMPDGAFHEVKGRFIGLGASIADLPETQDHMASSGVTLCEVCPCHMS